MVQIPHVGTEELAGSDHQVTFYDLSGHSESPDYMLDYILVLNILKFHMFGKTVEIFLLCKDIFHGIDLRTCHYI